jgi:hypothetical protein
MTTEWNPSVFQGIMCTDNLEYFCEETIKPGMLCVVMDDNIIKPLTINPEPPYHDWLVASESQYQGLGVLDEYTKGAKVIARSCTPGDLILVRMDPSIEPYALKGETVLSSAGNGFARVSVQGDTHCIGKTYKSQWMDSGQDQFATITVLPPYLTLENALKYRYHNFGRRR